MAARTIAERGVQLIGTAHGNALDNLMLNPTLSDLVGGIESVTLSDDEARRRGTQKTVLERRAPPTFDVLIEIQTRDRLVVHEDVSAAVDGILRGRPMPVEIRARTEAGEIIVETQQPETSEIAERQRADGKRNKNVRQVGGNAPLKTVDQPPAGIVTGGQRNPLTVYAYGVARNRLQQAGQRLRVPLNITDDFGQADAVVTLKNYYRRRPRLIVDAERRGMPIYVLRANTATQMENFVIDVFGLEEGAEGTTRNDNPFGSAMQEAEQAILRVLAGDPAVDLAPQPSKIRREQHEMASRSQLSSESIGREPRRYVRIFREL
jgi:hypothetical protein